MICEYVGELVVERCWCGIQHAVPKSLIGMQQRQFNDGLKQTAIYCPLGHTWICTGTTQSQRMEAELQRERQKHDQTKAALRDEKNKVNAEKAAKSRIKNRVSKGICPCCNRYFANLHRHMVNQHPEVKGSEA